MASNLKIRKKSIRLEAQEQARNKNQSETVSKDDRSGGKIVLRKSLPRKSKLKKVLGVEEKGDIKEEILAIINHVIENVVASSDLKVEENDNTDEEISEILNHFHEIVDEPSMKKENLTIRRNQSLLNRGKNSDLKSRRQRKSKDKSKAFVEVEEKGDKYVEILNHDDETTVSSVSEEEPSSRRRPIQRGKPRTKNNLRGTSRADARSKTLGGRYRIQGKNIWSAAGITDTSRFTNRQNIKKADGPLVSEALKSESPQEGSSENFRRIQIEKKHRKIERRPAKPLFVRNYFIHRPFAIDGEKELDFVVHETYIKGTVPRDFTESVQIGEADVETEDDNSDGIVYSSCTEDEDNADTIKRLFEDIVADI